DQGSGSWGIQASWPSSNGIGRTTASAANKSIVNNKSKNHGYHGGLSTNTAFSHGQTPFPRRRLTHGRGAGIRQPTSGPAGRADFADHHRCHHAQQPRRPRSGARPDDGETKAGFRP